MTKEDLLRPRYKVIEKYPFSPYEVGDIIELTDGQTQFIAAETSQYNHFQPCTLLEELPNIYQPLHWWEDRKTQDMPQYLHCPSRRMFFKVDRWHKSYFIIDGRQKMQYRNYVPATEEEYNEYLKTNP